MHVRRKVSILRALCPLLQKLSSCKASERKKLIRKMSRSQFICFMEFLYNTFKNDQLVTPADREHLRKCLLPYKNRLRGLFSIKMSTQKRKRWCGHLQSCLRLLIKCGYPHLYHTLYLYA